MLPAHASFHTKLQGIHVLYYLWHGIKPHLAMQQWMCVWYYARFRCILRTRRIMQVLYCCWNFNACVMPAKYHRVGTTSPVEGVLTLNDSSDGDACKDDSFAQLLPQPQCFNRIFLQTNPPMMQITRLPCPPPATAASTGRCCPCAAGPTRLTPSRCSASRSCCPRQSATSSSPPRTRAGSPPWYSLVMEAVSVALPVSLWCPILYCRHACWKLRMGAARRHI